MASNIVAYVGCYSFDIILYLSRILCKLGRKVIIVDHSDTSALTYSIPQVSGLDASRTIITYRRVDFTKMRLSEEMVVPYDDVLIDFGLTKPEIELSMITKVVFVTDMFEYNLIRLRDIPYYDALEADMSMLIRDAVDCKITVEHILTRVHKVTGPENVTLLYREEKDYENSLNCHFNQVFTLRLSGMMKVYLQGEVQKLCHNNYKEIKRAYRKAQRGE